MRTAREENLIPGRAEYNNTPHPISRVIVGVDDSTGLPLSFLTNLAFVALPTRDYLGYRIETEDTVKSSIVLPCCSVCGKVMMVTDLKRLALEMGFQPPSGEHQFAIECCEYGLTIDDDEVFRQTIDALMAYHKSRPTAGNPESVHEP